MVYFWFLLIDVPLSLLRGLIALLGPLVVSIALPFARDNHLPKWASWWDNPDYGVTGNHSYLTIKDYNPMLKYAGLWPSNWYWLVIRNPANGLAVSKLFSVVQSECDYIKHIGAGNVDNSFPGWQFVFARKKFRFYTGFYYFVGKGEYRIGFKLKAGEPARSRPVGMTAIINPFKRYRL